MLSPATKQSRVLAVFLCAAACSGGESGDRDAPLVDASGDAGSTEPPLEGGLRLEDYPATLVDIELPFLEEGRDELGLNEEGTCRVFTIDAPSALEYYVGDETCTQMVHTVFVLGPELAYDAGTIVGCERERLFLAPGKYALCGTSAQPDFGVRVEFALEPFDESETCEGNALIYNSAGSEMLSTCTTLVGDLLFGAPIDGAFEGPPLERIDGNLGDDSADATVDFPAMPVLEEITGELALPSVTRTEPSFPALKSLRRLTVITEQLRAAGFPALETLERMQIFRNQALERLALPRLTSLMAINVVENEVLTEIDLGEPAGIRFDVSIFQNPMLSQCDVDALVEQLEKAGGIEGKVNVGANRPCE